MHIWDFVFLTFLEGNANVLIAGCILKDKRLIRKWGYSFSGTRAILRRYSAWEPRISTVAALSIDGLLCTSSERGTTNAERFLQFLEHDLLPTLQPFNGENPH